jgi:hypothetical protein
MPFKKMKFSTFFDYQLILKNFSRRMKHEKNVVDSAKKRTNLWQVSKVKINHLFLMVFAKKMT